MPRRDDDHFDDEDDVSSNRPRKSKSAFPVWLIVLLCALPVAAVVLIGGAIAMFTRQADDAQRAEVQANLAVASPPEVRLYTRDEVKAMMMATPEDVSAALGPPEVRIVTDGRTTWHYHNRTIDTATGKIDPVTKVVFEVGVVVEVSF
jgi:hypothetical protein